MAERPAIFLTHIPRSGGTSLIRFLSQDVAAERQFPNAALDRDLLTAKISVAYLLNQPRERLEQTDFFCPHMPHAVSGLLGLDLFTVTLVRDPVERVRSVLDLMATRHPDDDAALERAYAERDWAQSWFTANQLCFYLGTTGAQVEAFAALGGDLGVLNPTQEFERRLHSIVGSDEELVASACRTLESIDAVGLSEQSDALLSELEHRLGATASRPPGRLNRGQGSELSPGLRRQLESVTAADREIYAYAVELVARRAATRH